MKRERKDFASAFSDSAIESLNKEAGTAAFESLSTLDSCIEKYAGISIYQPTIDNVERFVKQYTDNELAFLPISVNSQVLLIPSDFSDTNSEYVSDASGMVTIKVSNTSIQLPFVVMDGELVPFDVIQLGNQRVPYSKTNIVKIVNGIFRQEKEVQDKGGITGEFAPYLKVDKPVNPSTSIGFLGNVMSIQDRYSNRGSTLGIGMGPGDNFVTAEEILTLTEKLAGISKLDLSELEKTVKTAAENYCYDIAVDDMSADYKDTDKIIKKQAEMVENTKFVSVKSLPNGTFVAVPTAIQVPGRTKELTMTQAVVIKDFLDLGFKNESVTIILTLDGKAKILKGPEDMIGVKMDNPTFKLPTSSLATLKRGETFMAFNGDKAIFPLAVKEVTERSFEKLVSSDNPCVPCSVDGINTSQSKRPTLGQVIYRTTPISSDYDSMFYPHQERMDFIKERVDLNLVPLKGARFDKYDYDSYIAGKAKEVGMDEIVVGRVLSPYTAISQSYKDGKETELGVLACDPDTKIINIIGIFTGYLKSEKDIHDFLANEDRSFEIFKQAGENEMVEVRSADRNAKTYNIKVTYIDKSKKLFKSQIKNFDGLEEYKAKGILKACGFDQMRVSDIMYKARTQNYVKLPLPDDATPDKLSGGNTQNMLQNAMGRIKSVVFAPEVKEEFVAVLAGAALGQLANDITKSVNMPGTDIKTAEMLIGDKVEKTASELFAHTERHGEELRDTLICDLSKKATLSDLLSEEYEKIAVEKKSDSFKTLSATMKLSNVLYEKTAEFIKDDEFDYSAYKKACEEIASKSSSLEKLAFECIKLKVDQYNNNNQIVHPAYLQETVNILEGMNDIACAGASIKL